MSVPLLLVHGDDGFGLDAAVRDFASSIDANDIVEISAGSAPDGAIDRAQLEAGTMSLFGSHLAVLRQPLKAAGRSTAMADKLLALVADLPDGSALALLEERPSRDITKPPTLLKRLADAVKGRGGRVEEHAAPRRGELRGWITTHAARIGVRVETRAAHVLAERIGGSIWETDVERGEMTRIADSELRKLATYAGERPITADDVETLTADTRPHRSSRSRCRRPARARGRRGGAPARTRRGQPGLRNLASLAGRVSDLIVARDLAARKTPPTESRSAWRAAMPAWPSGWWMRRGATAARSSRRCSSACGRPTWRSSRTRSRSSPHSPHGSAST